MTYLPFTTLSGHGLVLRPLGDYPVVKDALMAAFSSDVLAWDMLVQAGFGPYFEDWFAAAMRAQQALQRQCFVVFDAVDGDILGTTSFLHLNPAFQSVEIGSTFLVPKARGGWVNPAIKTLLLSHAFAHGVYRVEIVTDARNIHSQRAIEKLGAQKEGVLRAHKVLWTGYRRDTVVYSILKPDWPAVEAGLLQRLKAKAPSCLGAT